MDLMGKLKFLFAQWRQAKHPATFPGLIKSAADLQGRGWPAIQKKRKEAQRICDQCQVFQQVMPEAEIKTC